MLTEPSLSETVLNWLTSIYYLGTIATIIVAAFWAFAKTKIFRELKPSLDLELQVEDRKIADGKTYILVLLRMTNTSKVLGCVDISFQPDKGADKV